MKYTHKGLIVNSNYGNPIRSLQELRETANYWATSYGTKFRKSSGAMVGGSQWNQCHLKLDSIKPI